MNIALALSTTKAKASPDLKHLYLGSDLRLTPASNSFLHRMELTPDTRGRSTWSYPDVKPQKCHVPLQYYKRSWKYPSGCPLKCTLNLDFVYMHYIGLHWRCILKPLGMNWCFAVKEGTVASVIITWPNLIGFTMFSCFLYDPWFPGMVYWLIDELFKFLKNGSKARAHTGESMTVNKTGRLDVPVEKIQNAT